MQHNSSTPDKLISIVSYAIPIVVALLLGIRTKIDLGSWTHSLTHINAIINFSTSVFLILGLIAIKSGKINLHKTFMLIAFGLGSLFLVSYVLFHLTHQSTSFGGIGLVKYFYYFLLISHILLAAVVVKLVLMALYYALKSNFIAHKRIVRYTLPIWLYVSITGVIVYLMIKPYYLM